MKEGYLWDELKSAICKRELGICNFQKKGSSVICTCVDLMNQCIGYAKEKLRL